MTASSIEKKIKEVDNKADEKKKKRRKKKKV